jgi:hypothetical protein
MAQGSTPVEIFCCYAREDEDWLRKLETHLSLLRRRGLVSLWHDRLITPGTNWRQTIDQRLEKASVILLLVSADFLASDYCYGVEMKRALEREARGEAHVVPILIRPVDWTGAPFAHLRALPTNAQPITTWKNRDEAFREVAHDIREAIEKGISQKQSRTVESTLERNPERFEDTRVTFDDPMVAKVLELRPRSYDGKRFWIPKGFLRTFLFHERPEKLGLSDCDEGCFVMFLFATAPDSSIMAAFPAVMPFHTFEDIYQANREGDGKVWITNIEGRIKHHQVRYRKNLNIVLMVEKCQIL